MATVSRLAVDSLSCIEILACTCLFSILRFWVIMISVLMGEVNVQCAPGRFYLSMIKVPGLFLLYVHIYLAVYTHQSLILARVEYLVVSFSDGWRY